MLKVVVYDNGYGGELFADRLESELPILDVIRVIDWRNASAVQSNPRKARKLIETALRPYLGEVDLIIFANYLIASTNLKYFTSKYQEQAFLGLHLPKSSSVSKREVLVLGTKTLVRTLSFKNYLFRLPAHTTTLCLDEWQSAIDDGELTSDDIKKKFVHLLKQGYMPEGIIMTSGTFYDITPQLRSVFKNNIKIYDDFTVLIDQTCRTLKIRGGRIRKK
ncbi:hypothetical protein IJ101_03155 [Candidatus Saccharibacteria bacterium]|nr:hypothetical protein [Candidatus Saccharibacteria bacterium]